VLEQAGPVEALGQCCGLAAAAAASGADQSGAAVAQNMSFIGVMDELQQEGGAGEVHHAELLSSTGHRSNCVDGDLLIAGSELHHCLLSIRFPATQLERCPVLLSSSAWCTSPAPGVTQWLSAQQVDQNNILWTRHNQNPAHTSDTHALFWVSGTRMQPGSILTH
jgi:hypothetical protein